MPIYEYLCQDCGKTCELLVVGSSSDPACKSCGSTNLKKLLSAHAVLSEDAAARLPGAGDTTCCGSNPGQAGCSGPGSCCGKSTG